MCIYRKRLSSIYIERDCHLYIYKETVNYMEIKRLSSICMYRDTRLREHS